MLEAVRAAGAQMVLGTVEAIQQADGFAITVSSPESRSVVKADVLVNAAGPFAGTIGRMLDVELPIKNVFQQKVAFEDTAGTIPRSMPFSIDLDPQLIDWSEEEKELIEGDPAIHWLAEQMPGSIHCRPDGGDGRTWVKLGWAYNNSEAEPTREQPLDGNFPEIVLRGAARLNPDLRAYYGQLPRNRHHYGGWYSMTAENWPLVGPMGKMGGMGAFMNCAPSGFGTMTACSSGGCAPLGLQTGPCWNTPRPCRWRDMTMPI